MTGVINLSGALRRSGLSWRSSCQLERIVETKFLKWFNRMKLIIFYLLGSLHMWHLNGTNSRNWGTVIYFSYINSICLGVSQSFIVLYVERSHSFIQLALLLQFFCYAASSYTLWYKKRSCVSNLIDTLLWNSMPPYKREISFGIKN